MGFRVWACSQPERYGANSVEIDGAVHTVDHDIDIRLLALTSTYYCSEYSCTITIFIIMTIVIILLFEYYYYHTIVAISSDVEIRAFQHVCGGSF